MGLAGFGIQQYPFKNGNLMSPSVSVGESPTFAVKENDVCPFKTPGVVKPKFILSRQMPLLQTDNIWNPGGKVESDVSLSI